MHRLGKNIQLNVTAGRIRKLSYNYFLKVKRTVQQQPSCL
jgi:hypothetical protein